MSLYETYFVEPLRALRKEEVRVGEQLEDIKGFVTARYFAKFEQDISGMLAANEVTPGNHDHMVHQTGVRAGLLMVQAHLDTMKRRIREQNDV